jgi:hypothetical protein
VRREVRRLIADFSFLVGCRFVLFNRFRRMAYQCAGGGSFFPVE